MAAAFVFHTHYLLWGLLSFRCQNHQIIHLCKFTFWLLRAKAFTISFIPLNRSDLKCILKASRRFAASNPPIAISPRNKTSLTFEADKGQQPLTKPCDQGSASF